jgi:hypothetical protein
MIGEIKSFPRVVYLSPDKTKSISNFTILKITNLLTTSYEVSQVIYLFPDEALVIDDYDTDKEGLEKSASYLKDMTNTEKLKIFNRIFAP